MKDFALTEREKAKIAETLDRIHEWCAANQWAVGIGEMAAGASLISMGIHIGEIQVGRDVVGTKIGGFNVESLEGGAIGGGAGALAGAILGSVGIVGGGVAIGIPAWLIIAGGAAVFGAAGYSVGDSVHNFLHPAIDLRSHFVGASLLTIGTALLIKGARRLIADEKFKLLMSDFCEGILHLPEIAAEVVVDSLDTLKNCMERFASTGTAHTAGSAATGVVGGLAGAAIGSSVAASTVTVLGSHTIGGLAVSLGLVSAPLWPIIAGGAAGLVVGYGAWRTIQVVRNR